MQKEFEKFMESDIMEGMPSISAVIKSIKTTDTDRRLISVYIDKAKIKSKQKEISFLTYQAKELNFMLEFVDESVIAEHCVGNSHGGIMAFCTKKTIPKLSIEKLPKNGVYFMLEGVEDPYNFGYSVRSIYASGADGVIVPERNWMGASGVVARSSAGTSELIDMYVSDTSEAIDVFKAVGYSVICAGIRDSESVFTTSLQKPLLVILGGEKRGISREILNKADKIVRIDYGTDFSGSLSTAASAAVFAFEIYRYNLLN